MLFQRPLILLLNVDVNICNFAIFGPIFMKFLPKCTAKNFGMLCTNLGILTNTCLTLKLYMKHPNFQGFGWSIYQNMLGMKLTGRLVFHDKAHRGCEKT